MSCSPFREALSARLDGEALGLPHDELEAHLACCPDCVRWADQAATVTRRARVAPALVTPDLTRAVLSALPTRLPGTGQAARERRTGVALRVVLVLVGLVQAVLAWPSLVHGDDAMSAPVHMAHEAGAWNGALAVAFLAVAAAPRLAAGALPFLGTFVTMLTVVTVRDLAAGRVDADRAVGHLLLLTGLVVIAVLAWRGRRPRRAPGAVLAGRGAAA